MKLPQNKNDFDLQRQFYLYLNKWPWFLLSLLIVLFATYIMLRYSVNEYQSTARVMIKDTRSGGISETWALGELDVLGSSFNTVENEIEILKSVRLMENVVTELKLQKSYTLLGRLKSEDLYIKSPFEVDILNQNPDQKNKSFLSYELKHLNFEEFKYRVSENDNWQTHTYDSIFQLQGLDLKMTFNSNKAKAIDINTDATLRVDLMPVNYMAKSLVARLQAVKTDKRSSVVQLSITDNNTVKASHILDKLVEVYNEDAIIDKNKAAQNTAKFIDERLEEVAMDLDSIERRLQNFKNNKNLTDLPVESVMGLEASLAVNKELLQVDTELKIAQTIQNKLVNSSFEILPTNVVINGSESLNSQLINYNTLLGSYLELKEGTTAINPSFLRVSEQLDQVKQTILLSLESAINGIRLKRASILLDKGAMVQKVSTIPENERLNRKIERTRKVVETIFLLLSEKRESTAISLAIATPKAKVVDYASSSNSPVKPRKNVIYISAFIIGLLVPFIVIYLRQLLYNKVENRNDVENMLSNVSILGEIPKINKDDDQFITENDRSVLAESFRIIRTNLQYVIASSLNQTKTPVVLITSTIKGEGKTFVSYNTASTLAYTKKKVLLIGGDVRNPQIQRFISRDKMTKNGLTEFLVDESIDPSSIISEHPDNKNLHLIHSGKIPPNPAELLLNDRVQLLIDECKKNYDIVLIDSAPTILVTDTFLISKYADVTMYVARANYTDKILFNHLRETIDAKKLVNVSVVVNDVKISSFGYGRKYAYQYGADTDLSIVEKITKFFKRN